MKRVLLSAVLATFLLTAPAGAVVYVEGTGEPAFTNTTTNTQWMKWQGSSAYEQYRIEADYYAGSNLVKHENGGFVAPDGSGVFSLGWQSLHEGTTYTICSYGRRSPSPRTSSAAMSAPTRRPPAPPRHTPTTRPAASRSAA